MYNFCIILHTVAGPYFVSDLGILCTNPIDDKLECERAAHYFDAVPTVAEGNGHDLPYGCILHQMEYGNSVVYWNKGGVIDGSLDPKIQQLCVHKKEK